MRITAKNAARPWGFTLVELLTVIAIIAVLATLLSASLASAQRKARKTASISNLRQIMVAFVIYGDDHGKRPGTYRVLAEGKFLAPRILICPEDRVYGNWAGMIEGNDALRTPVGGVPSSSLESGAGADLPHSYFKAFDLPNELWTPIERDPMGGVAACQLHGIGRQEKEVYPHLSDYQGLVLRALKDGSVVSRQVYWQGVETDAAAPGSPSLPTSNFGESPLPLFLDPR